MSLLSLNNAGTNVKQKTNWGKSFRAKQLKQIFSFLPHQLHVFLISHQIFNNLLIISR